jgi:two-component system, OmpR family, sensor histidine kinase MtrB
VADSGPGVDEARLPHLFSAARRPRADGAGLGLTIARRIVLAHGGDLTVRNLPESGAEFTASIAGRAG